MNEYLSAIRRADFNFSYFVEQLRNLDRPVVLVFFGDHQPNITVSYNDLLFPDEDEIVHQQRIFQTVYSIWANYNVAGNEQVSANKAASTSNLAAQMLYQIGAPLTEYQKSLFVLSNKIPAYNAFGVMATNGNWYAADDTNSDVYSLEHDLCYLSYLEFTSKV